MDQMRIFVSHSHEDTRFCDAIVRALRGAGADVWYDEHNLGMGHLLTEIQRELNARHVFLVILSKAAFGSPWVLRECEWAFNLYTREPDRVILPVTAEPIAPSDFNTWLFLESFKRIEAPGFRPLPLAEAIEKTLHTLVLAPQGTTRPVPHVSISPTAQRRGELSILWVDDEPSNNIYERRTFIEDYGIHITISTSTDDALGKLIRQTYDVIISDMGRPPDNRAGYTLLDEVRKLGITTPFIIYAAFGSRPEHTAEALERGAQGSTGTAETLFDLVTTALGIK